MRTLVTAFIVLAAMGCGEGLIQPGTTEVEVATDRVAYVAGHVRGEGDHAEFGFTLRLSVTNIGTGTVFLPRCRADDTTPSYGISLVRYRDDIGAAYNPTWGCAGHSNNIRLDPGQRRSFDLRIQGPNMWDGHTGQPLGVLEGEMRLAIGVRGTMGRGIEGGEAPGVSNVFTVTKAPQPRD